MTVMKDKTVKYVVLGAAGKTGGAVMEELLRVGTAGEEIRAVVRRRDARCFEWVQRGVDVVEADLFDPMEIRESLSGTQRAYFPPPFHPHMLQAFVVFLTAAQAERLEQVVLLSQWIASPQHPSLATRQHWLAEELLRNSAIRFRTVINPGMFADNFLRLADFASLLGFYPHMTDASASAPVATSDIARVVRVVMEDPERHSGQRYQPVRLFSQPMRSLGNLRKPWAVRCFPCVCHFGCFRGPDVSRGSMPLKLQTTAFTWKTIVRGHSRLTAESTPWWSS